MKLLRNMLWLIAGVVATIPATADDGHALWLRWQPNAQPAPVSLTVGDADDTSAQPSPTALLAQAELSRYWHGAPLRLERQGGSRGAAHAFGADRPVDDGFAITRQPGGGLRLVAATDAGLLYGAYHLLRLQATGQPLNPTEEHPAFGLRLLNHWDNLDGTVERGYAGQSIFWGSDALPADTTLVQYARANASVGINGTVLNNVNASPLMLSADRLRTVAHIADVLRPYGIRVFLSVNFASPMKVPVKGVNRGRVLATADPLEPLVAQWWSAKADEIYSLIPDFGGFLVKANSEGQPGPGDYQRTHAEGANMLADALQPHGGIVMWRAFVYGYHAGTEDRVMKAVNEFKPLDGLFRPNVILQIKNGPLDFQPREPYSPLFDQLTKTPTMAELQITQEYLGQSRHLVYLAPLWREFFDGLGLTGLSDSSTGLSPTTAETSAVSLLKGVAGVANIGDDANWCGHHFSQANWYAFGRQAWNPHLSTRAIATEWLRQTFCADPAFTAPMAEVMETSREACVDYMMPLGLHHIFKGDHHYGPEPEGNQPNFPDEWKPVWYHKADTLGLGFDRSHTGTNAVGQYRPDVARRYDSLATCPEELLLWFHHLPWQFVMPDGTTLWQSLCSHYNRGVSAVDGYAATWQQMRPYVDEQRFREVAERLAHQQANAREWRTHCLDYFRQFSRQPVVTP